MNIRHFLAVLVVVLLFAAAAFAQNVLNYSAQGGAQWVVGGDLDVVSGGNIDIESGAALKIGGTTVSSSAAELNYNDMTPGTGAVSKAVILDASGNYTFPGSGTIAFTSGGALSLPANVTLTAAGTNTLSGATTASGGLTTTDGDGGNGGYPTGIVGYHKMAPWSVGASVNGTTAGVKVGHIDETPAGEWTGTTNVTDATDSSTFRKGTASLSLAFTSSAVAGNGADDDASNEDWTDELSVGFWHRCDAVTTAGDFVLELTDGTQGASTADIPALATANKWTWVEVDISAIANGSKDDVDNVALDISAQGATAHGAITCHFDGMAVWDDANEEALGLDVIEDSVMPFAMVTATGGNRIPLTLVEYTSYLIHYEAGNDFFIAIDDQSGNSVWGTAALE